MLSASEIFELEKKVFRYRLKKKVRILSSVLVMLVLLSGGVFVYNKTLMSSNAETASPSQVLIDKNTSVATASPSVIKEETITTSASLAPTQETSQKIDTPKLVVVLPPEETLMLKSPSVNTGKENRTNTYLAPPKQEELKPFTGFKDQDEERSRKNTFNSDDMFYRGTDEKIDTTVLAPPLLEESKPKGIIKIETQEVNSIQYLKEKFEKTNNIIFALMLAEEFYNNKNYVESNKWALIANHLDSDSEKSWIWFAKSKLKLGQKEDAIVALKAYLKTNKSKMAQTLLNQISMGEINE